MLHTYLFSESYTLFVKQCRSYSIAADQGNESMCIHVMNKNINKSAVHITFQNLFYIGLYRENMKKIFLSETAMP